MSAAQTAGNVSSYDVVILGAGYAGLIAALRLGRQKWGLRVALINPRIEFLERVRLQESIVTPVYALGSRVDVDNVPGVAEHAYRLDSGDGSRSAAALRSRLHQSADRPVRVICVGGGPTAVEVAGEIKTTWPDAEVTMVSQRCGDFAGVRVEEAVRAELGRLGVTLIDGEIVSEVHLSEVVTKTGRSIACDICIWSGGMRSSPVAHAAGLATDPQGRIWVDPHLRSISHAHILAVGDSAHPIAPTGAPYRKSALAAGASGAHAARVIVAQQTRENLQPFSFSTLAQAAAIGRLGVIYLLDRNDKQIGYIVKGRTARKLRDFFLLLVIYGFKLERKLPGSFFLPGTRRVSWPEANEAMQKFQSNSAPVR